jgi:hypothetical protein
MTKTKLRRPADDIVMVSGSGLTLGGRRRPLTRSSRRDELRSETVRLRHVASGVEKEFHLGPTRLSRGQWQKWRQSLIAQFRTELKRQRLI